MIKFLLKRLLALFSVVIGVTFLTFILTRLVPVDPAMAYLSANKVIITETALAKTRAEFGLDQPIVVQYVVWGRNLLKGDLGKSYYTNEPVRTEIMRVLPNTFLLAILAAFWIVCLSMLLGILSAVYKNRALDRWIRGLTFLGASIPGFLLGFLLIRLFAVKLKWLPMMGVGSLKYFLLPSMTLAVHYIAVYTRLVRSGVSSQLEKPFVRYAKMRGLSGHTIVLKYALKNALLPLVNAFSMTFGHLLAGSIMVEVVFSWPGLGRLITNAVLSRDYPVIQGYVLLMAFIFVISSLIADLICMAIDPRIGKEALSDEL